MKYKSKKNRMDSSGSLRRVFKKIVDSVMTFLLPKHHFSVFKPGELTDRWSKINRLEGGISVIEADKLIDTVLKRANIVGDSMADRVKKTKGLVSEVAYQDLWNAHRLRNSLVHDVDRLVDKVEIQSALFKMKKYLIELGAFDNEG